MLKQVGREDFKDRLKATISRLESARPAGQASAFAKKPKKTVTAESKPTLDYSDQKEVSKEFPVERFASNPSPSNFDSSSDEEDASTTATTVATWFKSVTGNAPLTAEALQLALQQMKTHLIAKNVAHDAAQLITDSVQKRLIGTTPGTFGSVSAAVLKATRETLRSLLAPDRPNDLLAAVEAKKPFVITFVGVNGVGKSTSLSKVAFWLLQHSQRVLIVAGDTFRAGAVEQLRVHVRNLSALAPGRVELFERGYGKDAAQLATEAIARASKLGFDAVLIDTAGRMQGNEPLMRELAKLVGAVKPDRLLFVGEALVGQEALSQLHQFNASLNAQVKRTIDGLIVSKVDTIDDRIGAVVSMTVAAKAPVLFLGCGQTYTDLKRLSIKQVIEQLLSK